MHRKLSVTASLTFLVVMPPASNACFMQSSRCLNEAAFSNKGRKQDPTRQHGYLNYTHISAKLCVNIFFRHRAAFFGQEGEFFKMVLKKKLLCTKENKIHEFILKACLGSV